jgi:hypothetical protein
MRITVFTDYRYVRVADEIWTERAFALFLNELAEHHELTIVGREGAEGQVAPRYRLAPGVVFHALPYYESLARPGDALRTLPAAIRALTARRRMPTSPGSSAPTRSRWRSCWRRGRAAYRSSSVFARICRQP